LIPAIDMPDYRSDAGDLQQLTCAQV
jgi:hypothetical protein